MTCAAKEAAEKVESVTSAAKAAYENKVIIAALKRCATQNQTFFAACKARAFPSALIAGRKASTPARENRAVWVRRVCATQNRDALEVRVL